MLFLDTFRRKFGAYPNLKAISHIVRSCYYTFFSSYIGTIAFIIRKPLRFSLGKLNDLLMPISICLLKRKYSRNFIAPALNKLVPIDSLLIRQDNRNIEKCRENTPEIIATIDQDGYFLSYYGPLKGLQTVTKENFVPRNRFKLDLISIGGGLAIRKSYEGNRKAFSRELRFLYNFRNKPINIPQLYAADFDKLFIVYAFIHGKTLREELAIRGAKLRDRDVESNCIYNGLSKHETWLLKIEEGKRILPSITNRLFIDNLFEILRIIHGICYLCYDIKYGNIVMQNGSNDPSWLDFDMARKIPIRPGGLFNILADRDVDLFNLQFGTQKPTYQSLKHWSTDALKGERVYSAAYIGAGLKLGKLWNLTSGSGRWHYILKDNLPSFEGNRVLDLGCNNGFVSLTMLREGAKAGIGIENDKSFAAQGRRLKEAFEWSDKQAYDYRIIEENMLELPNLGLGEFDIVIALCSIYYLQEEDIHRLIKCIHKISPILVMQCNNARNIGRKYEDTYVKASLEYNLKILEENGFSKIETIEPKGYDRPLIIARSN